MIWTLPSFFWFDRCGLIPESVVCSCFLSAQRDFPKKTGKNVQSPDDQVGWMVNYVVFFFFLWVDVVGYLYDIGGCFECRNVTSFGLSFFPSSELLRGKF